MFFVSVSMNQQVLDFSHDCSLWKPPSSPVLVSQRIANIRCANSFIWCAIVLFEVVTIKGTISTFLHLELLFPKVLLNKHSLLNVGKFNSFLNFRDI